MHPCSPSPPGESLHLPTQARLTRLHFFMVPRVQCCCRSTGRSTVTSDPQPKVKGEKRPLVQAYLPVSRESAPPIPGQAAFHSSVCSLMPFSRFLFKSTFSSCLGQEGSSELPSLLWQKRKSQHLAEAWGDIQGC